MLIAALASALMAGPLVFAAGTVATTPGSAFALGPNAIVPGFNSTVFGPNDDESYPSPIALPFTADFFGNNYSQLYLNNNGNVTFDSPLATFTPFDLYNAGRVIIAPFFADVDTRVGNTVTFGTGTVDGHAAWGANWPGVGCFSENVSVLDYFQVLLIDRSDIAANDFDIEFNYDRIQWDSGQASGGDANCLNGSAARAGYSNGTAENSFELPGSGIDNGFLDSNSVTGLVNNSLNSGQLGRYVFSVRNGQPTEPTTLTTSLAGGGQSGTAITVPAGTPVTDSASLSGANVPTATGTVTYTAYSDSTCQTVAGSGGTEPVTNGSVTPSEPLTFNTPGTYYWQAVYSGDTTNNGSVSDCGSETESVVVIALDVSSAMAPNPVTAGQNVLDTATVTAADGDAHGVSAVVSSDAGGTIVSATPSQGSCGPPAGTTVNCSLGVLAAGDSATIQTVVRTPSAAPDGSTFDVTTTAQSDEVPPPGVTSVASVSVTAPSQSQVTGYVPPGGTLHVGKTEPSPAHPTVASFTLPDTGPGATMTLQITSPTPTFCGGSACHGNLLEFNDFSGYTDPKHPAHVRLRYDQSVVPNGLFGKFYVQKTPGGPVSVIPNCAPRPHWTHAQRHSSKVLVHLGYGPHSGYASPSPCINAKKIGPGGDLQVEILVLSGDPKIGYR
jgi:hypothetical protein